MFFFFPDYKSLKKKSVCEHHIKAPQHPTIARCLNSTVNYSYVQYKKEGTA